MALILSDFFFLRRRFLRGGIGRPSPPVRSATAAVVVPPLAVPPPCVLLTVWRGATGCGARVRRYAGAPRGAGRRGGLGGACAGRRGSLPRVGGSHGGYQGVGWAHLRVARGSNLLKRLKSFRNESVARSRFGRLKLSVTKSVWVPGTRVPGYYPALSKVESLTVYCLTLKTSCQA